jgi:hypothetical protein
MARDRSRHSDPGAVLSAPGRRWLLLIHQLPSKPDYFRVKIWRRLQRIGAVAIKSSVYALPHSDQAVEDFQWIVREIGAAGGDASVCEASFVDGLSDGQIEGLFRAARSADYAAVEEAAEDLLATLPRGRKLNADRREDIEVAVSRLRRRLDEIGAIDFFGASSGLQVDETFRRLQEQLRTATKTRKRLPAAGSHRKKSGRVWVTRRGVYIDRIASAWLIRKYIDPRAKFRFVVEQNYRPDPSAVRFDMFDAEHTHEGDRCTFEVLLERFRLTDPALRALGEMVHDIDLRDRKYARPETSGLERMIDGICRTHSDDKERVALGAGVFDAVYESLRGERS